MQPVQGTDSEDSSRSSQVGFLSRPPNDKMRPEEEGHEYALEFVFFKIVDHGIRNDQPSLYRVQWYSYGPANDSWEPISHLPSSHILKCHNLRKLSLPPEQLMSQAQVG